MNERPMNLFLLILVILLAVLPGAERLLNHRLEHDVTEAQDVRRRKLKTAIAYIVTIAGILGVIMAVTAFYINATEKRDSKSREEKLSAQVQTLGDENQTLQSEVCRQTKAISDLLGVGANKPGVDVATRSDMLAVKRKLDIGDACIGDWGALISGWSNKVAQVRIDRERERLNAVEQQKLVLVPAIPVWDYAIRTFQRKLAGYVKTQGRTPSSDYVNLPASESLCRGWRHGPVGDTIRPDVCEITMGTNSAWSCKCFLTIPGIMGFFPAQNPQYAPHLDLECHGKSGTVVLSVSVYNNGVTTVITGSDGVAISESRPLAESQKVVDGALDDFIGSQGAELDVRKD